MNQAKTDKNWLINMGFICLSYSILITFLSYFTINYNFEFLKNSFLLKLYFSIDNSFSGYLIAGFWAFMDIYVLLTIFAIFYQFSEKIINSIDKNA